MQVGQLPIYFCVAMFVGGCAAQDPGGSRLAIGSEPISDRAPSDPAVPDLMRRAFGADQRAKSDAVNSLIRIGPPAAKELAERLDAATPDEQRMAIEILYRMGPKGSVAAPAVARRLLRLVET